jgi:hypothetical protein
MTKAPRGPWPPEKHGSQATEEPKQLRRSLLVPRFAGGSPRHPLAETLGWGHFPRQVRKAMSKASSGMFACVGVQVIELQ